MKKLAMALLAGFVFAVGLGLSGMTNPDKIIAFLDVSRHWDPSLLFVMAGAVAVHVGAAQWALRAQKPLWAGSFARPSSTTVDAPLVVGAALFGLGWGVSGFCPGPAVVDLAAPSASVLTFVAAMVAGMLVFRARKVEHTLDTPPPPRTIEGWRFSPKPSEPVGGMRSRTPVR